jgi:uroporphyrinogen-III decarboxylase
MMQKILEAGRLALDWVQKTGAMDGIVQAKYGVPGFAGSATKAPYDILGDTLRGTRGVMGDKFRRPEKVLKACERLVPLAINQGVSTCNVTGNPLVFIPLHKGADGFLSDADFKKFYWPSLKQVLLGLIEEGCVPLCFAEGGFGSRLAAISDPDIPAGRMVWMFDATDMREAQKHLGGYQCFGGNVPGAMLTTGTPEETDDYVRRLIEDVAVDGGFILSSGIAIDDAKAECMKAMIEAGLKYGAQV